MKTINMETFIHLVKYILTTLFIATFGNFAMADSSSMRPLVYEFAVEQMHLGEALIKVKAQRMSSNSDRLIIRKTTDVRTIISKIDLKSGSMESILLVDKVDLEQITSYSLIAKALDGTERLIQTVTLSTAEATPMVKSQQGTYHVTDPHHVMDVALDRIQ